MRFMPGLWGKQRALEAGKAEEVKRRTVPFDDMIEEYYRLRDIDAQGRPSRKRLESLDMKDVADALF
jgi:aldehyde:ferredoxin oxidoreductase